MKKLFISYRRQDSGDTARRLASECAKKYGEPNVFIDTDSIRIGDKWADKIDTALVDCSAVIAVIGPKWLHTHDQDGRRRIDNDSDWVRNELIHGLTSKGALIPVLVQGAQSIATGSLPDALKPLSSIQNYELSDRYWDRDINYLLSELDKLGFSEITNKDEVPYPAKRDKSVPLSDEEVIASFEVDSGWSLLASRKEIHGQIKSVKELYKTYEFQSFSDCIHFMMTASRHISTIDHHPCWENIWITLRVRLTTWDIGGIPSYKDIRLAKYLDEIFIAYKKKSEQ